MATGLLLNEERAESFLSNQRLTSHNSRVLTRVEKVHLSIRSVGGVLQNPELVARLLALPGPEQLCALHCRSVQLWAVLGSTAGQSAPTGDRHVRRGLLLLWLQQG